ncbi:MAG: twin-arginine translocase TatA/TatE family subunit [Bacteroidales bacterium]|jgi:sec-independent protein translocase protein TatA
MDLLSPWHLLVIILIILLLFGGGKKIPEMMRGLGQGINEFKKASRGEESEKKPEKNENEGDKNSPATTPKA